MVAGKKIQALFYLTHVNNIPSILTNGIMSHELVEKENIQFTPIYDEQIVHGRRQKQTPNGKSLWSFANFYFQPRNAMLYRVLIEKSVDDIVILAIRPNILNNKDIFISTGNAASQESLILSHDDGVREIPNIKKEVDKDWWSQTDGSKRKMMAEVLVPERVQADSIQAIYVASHKIADALKDKIKRPELPVIPQPNMFFQPLRKINLTNNLSLVEGDMFFSKMQTLTVSVNIVGIMGKGLASTAKYRFPDVYVVYQDLCWKRVLQMGKPYLYKRESSRDDLLADEASSLVNNKLATWFLLFATKLHWRNRGDIIGIEKGLEWIRDNYKKEGVSSLAVPALGCGLGGLEWRDVGPLTCSYLSSLDITVEIYLPAERKIPEEQLGEDFLLKSKIDD